MKVGDIIQWNQSNPDDYLRRFVFVDTKAHYVVRGLQKGGILLDVPGDLNPSSEWSMDYWEAVPKEFFVKKFINENL